MTFFLFSHPFPFEFSQGLSTHTDLLAGRLVRLKTNVPHTREKKIKRHSKRELNTEINWLFETINRFSSKIDSFLRYLPAVVVAGSIFSPRRRLYEPEALFDIYPPIFCGGPVLFLSPPMRFDRLKALQTQKHLEAFPFWPGTTSSVS